MAITMHPDLAAFDRLKTRIQGLRAKTTDNGCTEAEALSAAAKVAELLDRYDLSLTDVEIRHSQCEQRTYETRRRKRIPLGDCMPDEPRRVPSWMMSPSRGRCMCSPS